MSEAHHPEYDDSYQTCVRTYSTLRVFSDDITPEEITAILHLEPTEAFRKGDRHDKGKLQRKANGWFYSTKNLCASKDTRHHIDMILDALEEKVALLETIHKQGCKVDITSYWVSTGQGGPWLMPQQMLKLGRLGVAVWWDVYFEKDHQT